MNTKKARGLVHNSLKLPDSEIFYSEHNGEMVRVFPNVCEMYFKLISVIYKNIQTLFAKICIIEIARNWYDCQGYNDATLTFSALLRHILICFILSD